MDLLEKRRSMVLAIDSTDIQKTLESFHKKIKYNIIMYVFKKLMI